MTDALGGIASSLDSFEPALRLAWSVAVGGGLSNKTRPLGVTRGRLVVAVPDDSWRLALLSVRARVMLRLRAMLTRDAPTGLEVRVDDSLDWDWAPKRELDEEGPLVEVSPPREASHIRDADLRRAFERAYSAHARRHGAG